MLRVREGDWRLEPRWVAGLDDSQDHKIFYDEHPCQNPGVGVWKKREKKEKWVTLKGGRRRSRVEKIEGGKYCIILWLATFCLRIL